jgi:hypothetical protein
VMVVVLVLVLGLSRRMVTTTPITKRQRV